MLVSASKVSEMRLVFACRRKLIGIFQVPVLKHSLRTCVATPSYIIHCKILYFIQSSLSDRRAVEPPSRGMCEIIIRIIFRFYKNACWVLAKLQMESPSIPLPLTPSTHTHNFTPLDPWTVFRRWEDEQTHRYQNNTLNKTESSANRDSLAMVFCFPSHDN